MNSYDGGLAQSVTHYYAGATNTPKRKQTKLCKGLKMGCKKKSGTKPKK